MENFLVKWITKWMTGGRFKQNSQLNEIHSLLFQTEKKNRMKKLMKLLKSTYIVQVKSKLQLTCSFM